MAGKTPPRKEVPHFTRAEFEHRVERARALMTEHRLDGIVVCSEPNLEYLSGFRIEFAWNTPTRPWYFVLPRDGEATAVIPEIGRSTWLATSWCDNVETWPSPRPEDEGVGLLKAAVKRAKKQFGRIGFETGNETRLGTTVDDLRQIEAAIRPFETGDAVSVMRGLRLVKSKAEVAYLRRVCGIASDAFDDLPGFVAVGDTEREICRKFRVSQLQHGADLVPFLAIGVGRGGYHSVITGATERRLAAGDILNIDTGAKYGGYMSDFNRNFAIGRPPGAQAARLHDILWRATEAGIAAAVPGNTAEDLYRAQAKVLEDSGIQLGNVGRLGHGLGKTLTEYPSHKPGDRTVLGPGFVVTIEPSAMFGAGKVLVHEEDLVVTESGPVLLSRRAPREMPVILG